MIIRETGQSFIFIAQHDHATLSGQLAEHWKEDFFWQNAYTQDTLLAIYQHDRGWIAPDSSPGWDHENQKPYSFLSYPLEQKLVHYKQGIDEVEAMNSYAGVLCSMHYVSFMRKGNGFEQTFVEHEQAREHTLKEQLQIHRPDEEALCKYHFHLLQFFDDLSLYLCINHPGVPKEKEYPFFLNGFKNTELFAFTGGNKIQASWTSPEAIVVIPFPLRKEVEAVIIYREIPKKEIELHGLAKAYQDAPLQKYTVKVTG
jgi:hypothetical protein